jgi:pimeloyl-ACP methyl ester carboxylesterase
MKRVLLALLAALAVLLAVNTIVIDRDTESADADVGRLVDVGGDRIQLREDGSPDKPAVVLLHGFAASMHWWGPVASRLARDFHVIRIDLLGHGGSDKPRSGYGMEHQAQLVAGALRQVRVSRALVAGHSMGGAVATALAENSPQLVERLVIVDSPPEPDAGELPFLARLGFLPVLGEAINRLVTDGMVRDNLESAFAPGFEVPDQFVRDFRRMTYSSYDGSHQEAGDYGEERGLADRLASAGKPLLVIFGKEDDLVDPNSAQKYSRVDGARIVTIPSTGHSPQFERPGQVSALIRAFARPPARSSSDSAR